MQRLILPGEIGQQIEPVLTVEMMKQLIADLTTQYGRKPTAIMVSEYDRREMNQTIMAGATQPVAKDDQRPQHDHDALGYVDGVAILAQPDVSRGKARPVFGPLLRDVSERLGGEGKIIVGA